MSTSSGVTFTTSTGGTSTAAVLTGAQATQLLQRLKQSAGGKEVIEIRTVQTTAGGQVGSTGQPGQRQIIAIPIQQNPGSGSTTGANNISVSPLKVRPTAASIATTTAAAANAIKVVKLANTTPKQQQQQQQQQHHHIITSSPLLELGSSSSRKRSDIDFDAFSEAKRRKSDAGNSIAGSGGAGGAGGGGSAGSKGGKGLRHFSMKVCEKVQAKGSTSYNEVADELVSELTDPRCSSPTDQQYDQKNIRRRVYDALNVLMAMNIISKEKKEIRWLGLPTNSVQEVNTLELDKRKKMERIKAKTQQLQDLILQQIAFKNLVERNKEREKSDGAPAPNSAIQLPFIIVNTSKKTVIDCSISNDKMEYLFNFDDTFEIHDDMEVTFPFNGLTPLNRAEVMSWEVWLVRSKPHQKFGYCNFAISMYHVI